MAFALVAMPMLVRDAGPERLGFLGLAWALIGYFALLDLGLSRVITRRVAVAAGNGYLTGEARLVRRLCLQLFLGIVVISALLATFIPATSIVGREADPVVVAEAKVALMILWATLPFTVVTGLLRGVLEGLQAFGRVNLLRAFFGAWSFAAPLAVLPWSHSLQALTLAIAIGRMLSLTAHSRWAFAALRKRTAQERSLTQGDQAAGPRIANLFVEGGWLTVSNVVGPLMVTFDRFAIAGLVSLTAASYYFVPQEAALRMLIVPTAIAATIFPMLAGPVQGTLDHRGITQGAASTIVISCLPLCAVFAAFAHPLLVIWMGSRFAEDSAQVAACLAVGLFANCCAQVPFAWIQAAGRSDVTGKLHLIQLPIYAVLLVVLTMKWGAVGAAVAWSVRATADAVMLYVASGHLFHSVDQRPMLRPIVAGLVLLILLSATPWIEDLSVQRSTSSLLLVACLSITAVLAGRLWQAVRT